MIFGWWASLVFWEKLLLVTYYPLYMLLDSIASFFFFFRFLCLCSWEDIDLYIGDFFVCVFYLSNANLGPVLSSSDNLCLLIGGFKSFLLKVIFSMVWLESSILLFSICCQCSFKNFFFFISCKLSILVILHLLAYYLYIF